MKNRGDSSGPILIGIIAAAVVALWILWAYVADDTIPTVEAVDGCVVVIGRNSNNGNVLYSNVFTADQITGVYAEDDGIDVGIKGKISDYNIYNISVSRFVEVWNKAKEQLSAQGKTTQTVTQEWSCEWCGRKINRLPCPKCGKSTTQPAK